MTIRYDDKISIKDHVRALWSQGKLLKLTLLVAG